MIAPALRLRALLRLRLNGLATITARPPVALHAAAQTQGFGTSLGSSPTTLSQLHDNAEGVSHNWLFLSRTLRYDTREEATTHGSASCALLP